MDLSKAEFCLFNEILHKNQKKIVAEKFEKTTGCQAHELLQQYTPFEQCNSVNNAIPPPQTVMPATILHAEREQWLHAANQLHCMD